MKKWIIIFIMLCLSLSAFTKEKIEIMDFDFFGFKFNYNYEQIIKILNNQNKEYTITKDGYVDDAITLEPKNQNLIEGLNLDFVIDMYQNKIMILRKFKITEKYFKFLMEILGKNFKPIETAYSIKYVWTINNITIKCSKFKQIKNRGWGNIEIINNDLFDEYTKIANESVSEEDLL